MVASPDLLENRTPYGPTGFGHLGKPEASIVFNIPGYRIHYFSKDECRGNKLALMQTAVRLDMAIFKIPYWEARKEVGHNMGMESASATFVESLKPQRTPLLQLLPERGKVRAFDGVLRRLSFPFTKLTDLQADAHSAVTDLELDLEYPFVGYATQERWRVRTDSGMLTAVYLSTIALLSEHRRQGIGTFLIQLACGKHEPDIFLLRSQTGAIVATVENAIKTVGPAHGVDVEWYTDPEMMSLKKPFIEKTLHPNGIDDKKLIAIGVYPEGRNRAYTPDPNNKRASDADQKLDERIDIDRGDGAYIGWRTAFGRGRQRFFVVPRLPLSV